MLDTVVKTIENAISAIRVPLPKIPAIMIACAAIKRPGLSAMLITSDFLRRMPEAGVPQLSPIDAAVQRLHDETLVNAIKSTTQVQTVIQPGGIIIQNADGSTGTNINYVGATGILQ